MNELLSLHVLKKRDSFSDSNGNYCDSYFINKIAPQKTSDRCTAIDINVLSSFCFEDFSETVLAANLSFAKYWWLSGNTSLGISLISGVYGLTVTTGELNSVGWNAGIGLAFLFG